MRTMSNAEAISIAKSKQDRQPRGWRMHPCGAFDAGGYVLSSLVHREDEEDDYAFHFVLSDEPGGEMKLIRTQAGGLVAKGTSGRPVGYRPHMRLFHLRPDFDDFPTFTSAVSSIQKAEKTGRKIYIIGKAFFESTTENSAEFDQYMFDPAVGFDNGCKCPHIELTRAIIERSRIRKLLDWF